MFTKCYISLERYFNLQSNGAENVSLGCKLKVNENIIKTQFISILLLCNVSMQWLKVSGLPMHNHLDAGKC